LMCKIDILSINSPNETGVLIIINPHNVLYHFHQDALQTTFQ